MTAGFVFYLPDPENLPDAELWLTDQDLARVERHRDRALRTGSYALLRYSLWKIGSKKGDLIVTDPSGKPRLADQSLHFSLSHCPGMAICAVSRQRPVGADVEKIRPELVDDQVAEQVFCAEERSWVAGSAERFFRLWVVKEAVFKAAGTVWDESWRDRSVLPELASLNQRRLGTYWAAATCAALWEEASFSSP